ncbi:MAG: hypothetical protein KF781_05280 [Chitinophagaceae bacterium]|nr:hypothetical protein [Chitinophagaceae bacterium]MCW5905930.1 hypothetical protein [Chitinophagaceae bacterium]
MLVLLFMLKVVAGLGYAMFYNLPSYHADSDSFRYFHYSIEETDMLLKSPLLFLKDLFSYGYNDIGNVFIGNNSYWNDLKSNIVIKLLAVCNVFSFKNYYINIIFFNFFFFFGLIGFFRVMNNIFLHKGLWLLIPIFCIPSFLFWSSGIHRDGLIFSATGLIIYFFYNSMNDKFTVRNTLFIVALLLLLFAVRNYVCLALIMSLTAWFVSTKTNRALASFITMYVLAIIVFFLSGNFHSSFNLLAYIANKQHEFVQLSGGSEITLPLLQPTISGFVSYLPAALDMALLRPHITELKNLSYLPAVAETILLFALLILFFIYRDKKQSIHPAVLACIFLGFSLLLIAGYTVTFSGAIVRYRSFVLPLIITPLVGMLRFKSLQMVKK